jgi:hypothetical protein
VTSKGLGDLARKYLPFTHNKFIIWADEEDFHIGNKSNKFVIDGKNLIINNRKYKGTHGLWWLLTDPNKKKMDQETYDSWWTNNYNFTEKI